MRRLRGSPFLQRQLLLTWCFAQLRSSTAFSIFRLGPMGKRGRPIWDLNHVNLKAVPIHVQKIWVLAYKISPVRRKISELAIGNPSGSISMDLLLGKEGFGEHQHEDARRLGRIREVHYIYSTLPNDELFLLSFRRLHGEPAFNAQAIDFCLRRLKALTDAADEWYLPRANALGIYAQQCLAASEVYPAKSQSWLAEEGLGWPLKKVERNLGEARRLAGVRKSSDILAGLSGASSVRSRYTREFARKAQQDELSQVMWNALISPRQRES